MRIAIIGGGWAGLACAERLLNVNNPQAAGHLPRTDNNPLQATKRAPLHVTLFESAPMLGGRARGLIWQTDCGQRIAIDNGQHLTIGAYSATFGLLARCGITHWKSEPLTWTGLTSGGRISEQWRISDAAWPWRVAFGLLSPNAQKGWPWRWRQSLAATIAHLVRYSWQADSVSQTMSQWLERRRVPTDLVAHLWRPLIEGALNTELESASAAVSLRVLRDTIAGARGATRVWLPPSDLSSDGVDPIAASLVSKGLVIKLSHHVQQMYPDGRLTVRQSDQSAEHAFDAVVMACPHHSSLRLWKDSGLPMGDIQHRWNKLDHRAITTIWVALDAKAKMALAPLPQWFILNPQPGVPHIAQVGVKRADAMAFVVSAQQSPAAKASAGTQQLIKRDANRQAKECTPEDQRDALAAQLLAQLNLDIRTLPQKWITEKRATWACTTDAPMAHVSEAQGLTGVLRIFRAADDLEPGYPATIESAVRSGQRTADTLIRHLLT